MISTARSIYQNARDYCITLPNAVCVHWKVDTTQWQRNRDNFSRLYKSLRDAEISHRDMLAVVGNPYIRYIKDWRNIPWAQKQTLLQEHPEMPELSMFLEKTKSEFKAITPEYKNLNLHEQKIVDEGIEDLSFWFIPALPAKIPNGLRVAYATFKAKVPQIAKAYSAKPEFVRNIVNFFKKKANDGLKKSAENNAPRVQATHGDADKYLNGLKDKGVLGKKGVTKDGHEYYQFTKKCEYKGIKFKKDEYISRDTQHHEWEYFRNPKTHNGAIDPIKGLLDESKAVPGRTLKLP